MPRGLLLPPQPQPPPHAAAAPLQPPNHVTKPYTRAASKLCCQPECGTAKQHHLMPCYPPAQLCCCNSRIKHQHHPLPLPPPPSAATAATQSCNRSVQQAQSAAKQHQLMPRYPPAQQPHQAPHTSLTASAPNLQPPNHTTKACSQHMHAANRSAGSTV
jgi:hypothetical protein